MPEHLEYIAAGLEPFKPVDDSAHLFRKELIYEGDFVQKKETGVLRFSVTPETINGWCSTANLMLSRGIKINTPIEHTTNPEKNRGHAVRFETGVNEKGKRALFAYIKFRDAEAARLASSGVSINAEKEFTDGLGNTYKWPITHIALTDYPTVPDLEPFRAIAASLVKEDKMSDSVIKPDPIDYSKLSINDLIKQYKISVPDDADDDTKKKALKEHLDKLNNQFFSAPAPEKKPESKPENDPAKIAASNVNQVTLSMVSRGRKAELETLVQERKMTPAQRDKLAAKYCADEHLRLALSQNSGDDFDSVVDVFRAGEPIINGDEKTGPQSRVALSNLLDATKNPLLADAEGRAKAAASN